MVGWHYRLNGHESKHDFEQTPETVKDRKPGVLQPWGYRELDTTEQRTTTNILCITVAGDGREMANQQKLVSDV